MNWKTSLGAVAAAALVGVIGWRAVHSTTGHDRGPPPVPVTVSIVKLRDVNQVLTAVGTVQSLTNVLVRPQIDGVLTEVLVSEGQRVERGQVLAQIDDRALAAAVAQARAEQARNTASLKIAQLDLKRDENLLLEQAISRQAVEQQRALTEQIEATIQSNEAAAQAAAIQQSYARIVSPVSGKVGMRRVDRGNLVHASDAGGLFTVVQVDPISVVFSLPQQALPQLQPLLSEPSAAEVIAFDRDAGMPLATGRLMSADNQVDSATGTIQVRALFANAKGLLWPGEFVTVKLRTGIERGALTVESKAVQHGIDGDFVFRIRANAAEPVPVIVRHEQDSIASIDGTLTAGDAVVVEGQSQLRSGAAVQVMGAP
jgi:RND family efflux transporter MFP subunit